MSPCEREGQLQRSPETSRAKSTEQPDGHSAIPAGFQMSVGMKAVKESPQAKGKEDGDGGRLRTTHSPSGRAMSTFGPGQRAEMKNKDDAGRLVKWVCGHRRSDYCSPDEGGCRSGMGLRTHGRATRKE